MFLLIEKHELQHCCPAWRPSAISTTAISNRWVHREHHCSMMMQIWSTTDGGWTPLPYSCSPLTIDWLKRPQTTLNTVQYGPKYNQCNLYGYPVTYTWSITLLRSRSWSRLIFTIQIMTDQWNSFILLRMVDDCIRWKNSRCTSCLNLHIYEYNTLYECQSLLYKTYPHISLFYIITFSRKNIISV